MQGGAAADQQPARQGSLSFDHLVPQPAPASQEQRPVLEEKSSWGVYSHRWTGKAPNWLKYDNKVRRRNLCAYTACCTRLMPSGWRQHVSLPRCMH